MGILATVIAMLFLSCSAMEKTAVDYVESLPPEEIPGGVITEGDLEGLPPVVRRYFEYSGVVGKPRIASFSLAMEGRIRQGSEAKWMPFVSRQYNLLSEPSRVYHIRATRTPMTGVDSYVGGRGRMQIKILNLLTVADSQGPEMDVSGLVTFLNDLAFCPIAYFSVPVTWRQVGERRAELSLSHAGRTVKAVLSFDESGRLVDWQSEDRYAEVEGEQRQDRWSTPMKAYGEVSGLRIPISGQGVHDYAGSPPYVYVELDRIRDLAWNRRGLPPAR
ncbi:MAG: hypothetical protein JW820_17390 [Spirochaetales bacterium]|nr:hypothetical protein [Spirochaetales bacterium]